MSYFVYPDSRAQFVDLLGRAGLLPDLHAGFGMSDLDSLQILDFWSYTRYEPGSSSGEAADPRIDDDSTHAS